LTHNKILATINVIKSRWNRNRDARRLSPARFLDNLKRALAGLNSDGLGTESNPPAVSLPNPPAVSLSNPPAVSLSNPRRALSGVGAGADKLCTYGQEIEHEHTELTEKTRIPAGNNWF
jgi:hypothetical protein